MIDRVRRGSNCEYDEFKNQDLGYADIQLTAENPFEVRGPVGMDTKSWGIVRVQGDPMWKIRGITEPHVDSWCASC